MNGMNQPGMAGMGQGMMGMNPMMMNAGMMGADGMNMFQGMPAMSMGMPGMMPGMGMGMPGPQAPQMGMQQQGPPSGGMGGGMGGGDGANPAEGRYYKTKICHRFTEGKCNYGPTCKYAHGESDLRTLPGGGGPSAPRSSAVSGRVMTPHGTATLGGGMAPAGGAMGMGMAGGGMVGGMGGMGMAGGMAGGMGGGMAGGMGAPVVAPGGMMPGAMGGMMVAAGGGQPMQQQQQPQQQQMQMQQKAPGDKGPHWRTRLCEAFMKEGSCRYGTNCTFAHGQHELRTYQGGGGGGGGGGQSRMGSVMRPNNGMQGGGGGGQQKRPLDGMATGPGHDQPKRARVEPVTPPDHEALPQEGASMDLDAMRQRFEALQQEANRFARDTGHSVALFTVGGLLSDAEDSADFAGDAYVVDVKSKDGALVAPGLKVAVLKYGTGGVAKHLVTRGEIVKFVCARGTKALSEMHAAAREEPPASA